MATKWKQDTSVAFAKWHCAEPAVTMTSTQGHKTFLFMNTNLAGWDILLIIFFIYSDNFSCFSVKKKSYIVIDLEINSHSTFDNRRWKWRQICIFFITCNFILDILCMQGELSLLILQTNKLTPWLHDCVVYCVKQGSKIYWACMFWLSITAIFDPW